MNGTVAPRGFLKIVDRAAEITGTYGHTRVMPEQFDAATRAILIVEHVHNELITFIVFVYQKDVLGRWLHILSDGQMARGVWTPWGSSGKATLTRRVRDTVRKWLRIKAVNRLRPPFLYDSATNRWYIDLRRYPTVDGALDWAERHRMTANEWLSLT